MTRWLSLLLFLLSPLVASAQTDTNAAPADNSAVVTNAAPDTSAPPAPATAPTDLSSPATAPAGAPPIIQGSAGPSQPDDIDDIRPPFFFLHSWFWLWMALLAAAVIALLVWVWIKFKPTKKIDPLTAYDLALAKLEKAKSIMSEEQSMPYAMAASEAVRTYLGQRFQTPSSRRTTDEFLRLMERDTTTPLAEHRDLLRDFLIPCDLVKFGKYQPTRQELEDVHQRAWTFVTATKPLPLKPERNGLAS